ncbi:MAG TPA: SMC-Scp complex subunit ScpB [Bryobacteraceae bacterium]|nr:SMC-Scp complex subunit ScpB [Bryobacteraceae bacterium]
MAAEETQPDLLEAVSIEPEPQVEAETEALTPEELLPEAEQNAPETVADSKLKAVLEAIIYVTDEPLTLDQICSAIEQPRERIIEILEQLVADYEREDRGLSIREIAGGYKMTTKPEHHESVRRFVKNLNPPLKLSLPALETLAVIAYKQPITAPEIMEIRGVQGAGVLKTLLDRKLIATSGRKQVVGKPILYKTTREFLVQFGLKDLNELPTLKEFQEIGRMDTEGAEVSQPEAVETPPEERLLPVDEPQPEPPVSDPPATPDQEQASEERPGQG